MQQRKSRQLAGGAELADQKEWHGHETRDVHARAIGKIVLEWNELQEYLGALFAAVAWSCFNWQEWQGYWF